MSDPERVTGTSQYDGPSDAPNPGADGVTSPQRVTNSRTGAARRGDQVDISVAGIAREVSQRAERRAALSEQRFQALAETMPQLVFVCMDDGTLTYCNQRWRNYTGLSWHESLDAVWRHVIHEEDGERCRQLWVAARSSGEPYEAECRLRRADGTYLWHLVRALPDALDDGQWLGTATEVDERRRAQEAVAFSEHLYRSLAEALPALVIMTGPTGDVRYVNERLPAYTGRTVDELSGMRWIELIHPNDVSRGANIWSARVGTGRSFLGEYRVRRADGVYRWHIGHTVPLRDAHGKIVSWLGTTIDIDDRKRAEERNELLNRELQNRVEELQKLLDVLPVGVSIAEDSECVRVTVNQYLAQILRIAPPVGATAAEQREAGAYKLLRDGSEIPQGELPLQRAAASGIPTEGEEIDVLLDDGALRTIYGYAAPLFDEGGRPRGAVAAHVDVTERKRQESEQRLLADVGSLLSSSLNYHATLETISELMVPAFADICTIDMIEPGGQPRRIVTQCADPAKRPLVDVLQVRDWRAAPGSTEAIGDVLPRGQPIFVRDAPEWLGAGVGDPEEHERIRALDVCSFMLVPLWARNQLLGAMGLITAESGRRYDRADLAFAEELAQRAAIAVDNARLYREAQAAAADLRRANQAKDEFLGLVSHELRTPITAIFGNAQVLRKSGDAFDVETRTEALADIEAESSRLRQIIDNMFVLARIEGGGAMATEPIPVSRALERIVRDHLHHHPQRDIRLNATEDLPPVTGESTYFEQVVRNLLSNAEKYSAHGLPIDIEAEAIGDEVAVRVMDRGGGITEAEANKIFSAFYRSPSTSNRASGAGIGLAVCKHLVEVQGERVWARPRDEGGAEVGFTLPIDREAMA